MKPVRKRYLTSALGLALIIGLTGCATSQRSAKALVCPDCKMVEVTVDNSAILAESGSGVSPSDFNSMEHSCPNCQGAMKTFLTEGKIQHKCSTCAQHGFTSPAAHRWL